MGAEVYEAYETVSLPPRLDVVGVPPSTGDYVRLKQQYRENGTDTPWIAGYYRRDLDNSAETENYWGELTETAGASRFREALKYAIILAVERDAPLVLSQNITPVIEVSTDTVRIREHITIPDTVEIISSPIDGFDYVRLESHTDRYTVKVIKSDIDDGETVLDRVTTASEIEMIRTAICKAAGYDVDLCPTVYTESDSD